MSPPLGGPAPSAAGKYVKITIFLKKLPHVDDEYFRAYWANNHVAPVLKSKIFRDKGPPLQPGSLGVPVLEYDGIAEVWVDSMEDWMAAVMDPEVAGRPRRRRQELSDAAVGYDRLIAGEDWKPSGDSKA
ncbi:MAG: hypothetical protein STHCBS139747_001133 [Sporothrix thermara]